MWDAEFSQLSVRATFYFCFESGVLNFCVIG